jgi:PAS domain S-box-containing protein
MFPGDTTAQVFYYIDIGCILAGAVALLWTLQYYRVIHRLQKNLILEERTDRLLVFVIAIFAFTFIIFAYRLITRQGIFENEFSYYVDTLTSIIFCAGAIFVLYTAQALRRTFAAIGSEFSTMFSAAPIGLCTVSSKGASELLNPRFLAMAGLKHATDVVGKPFSTIPRYATADLDGKAKDALRGDGKFDTEVSFVEDGETVFQHWVSTPIFAADGHTIDKLLIVIEDVTSVKRAEESITRHNVDLENERIILENVVENISLGAILIDQKGHPLFMNSTVRALIGKSATDDTAAAYRAFLEKFAPFKIDELIRQCLEGKPISIPEAEIPEHILSISSVRLAPTSSQKLTDPFDGHLILINDITEERELERAKNDFVSIASHEMRTPLTIIRGNASLVREELTKDASKNAEALGMVESIESGSVRLMKIVNDFLDIVRLEGKRIQFDKEKFDMASLAREVANDIKAPAGKKGITLTFHEPAVPLPQVSADRERARQVVTNLTMNAVQYTDAGGTIELSIAPDGDYLKLSVSDTGIGMDEDAQKFLFQKFSTVGKSFIHSKEYGSGMGLYICRLLTEAMGGNIELEHSEFGKGSTFSFTLPIARS